MKVRSLLALGACLALVACDSDDSSGETTDTTNNTTTPDTTSPGSDSLVVRDVIPDIPTTPGTIKALQAEAETVGCNPTGIVTINPAVSVTGVIVVSPKYDAFTPDAETGEALDGYYVMDADGGPYSGINLVVLRSDATDYQIGDVLDVEGELEEFYCFSQLDGRTHTKTGTQTAPAPVEVDPTMVADEANEGRVISVKNVTVTEEVGAGVYRVDAGFLVDHDFDFFLSMEVGRTYDVTGAVKWAFNEWRLMPRTMSDLVRQGSGTATTIKDIQGGTASTGCTDQSIQNLADDLDVTGVVTVGKHSLADNLDGYYISDGTSDPFSGILVAVSANFGSEFAIGDEVAINGQHVEFFCASQIAADQISKTGTGTAPGPVAIGNNIGDVELEKWEGVLVEMNDVTVTGHTNFNEAETDAGVLIDSGVMGDAFELPPVGATLSSLKGALRYGFSRYRVSPRSAADLSGGPVADPGPEQVVEAPPESDGDTAGSD